MMKLLAVYTVVSMVVAASLSAPAATIIVACIVGGTGILTARIQNLKRTNREEHDVNHKLLLEIQEDVRRTEEKIDNHMAFHAHGQVIKVTRADEVEVSQKGKNE